MHPVAPDRSAACTHHHADQSVNSCQYDPQCRCMIQSLYRDCRRQASWKICPGYGIAQDIVVKICLKTWVPLQVIPLCVSGPGFLCGVDTGRLPGADWPSGPLRCQPGSEPGLDACEFPPRALYCRCHLYMCIHGMVHCRYGRFLSAACFGKLWSDQQSVPCSSSSTRRTSSWRRLTIWVGPLNSLHPSHCEGSRSASMHACCLHVWIIWLTQPPL